MIAAHVSSSLQTLSLPQHLSSDIKDVILKALEKDGTWLERYYVNNELHVTGDVVNEIPDSCDSDDVCGDDIKEAMDLVLTVRSITFVLFD